ncbi:unnamed protein product [Linum trigynum]|uniref:Uncharacterized protein n=1 Tax=Linum trigynum TaxID=586398 RepID=A0AAV2GDG4_9ROSI
MVKLMMASMSDVSLIYICLVYADEAERRRKEEADFKAKLAEIVEKQRRSERDLEEKERLRMAAALQGRPPRIVVPQRPGADPQGQGYVPRFRRGDDGGYYFVESEKGRLNIKL